MDAQKYELESSVSTCHHPALPVSHPADPRLAGAQPVQQGAILHLPHQYLQIATLGWQKYDIKLQKFVLLQYIFNEHFLAV